MGRKKGTPTKYYSKKEKEKIILDALENGINPVGRKYQISAGMICNWIKSYKENGNKVIDNKYKRGNPLSKYQNKKDMTELEKLEYENMKLRIENERLKKGYLVEGDGTVVVVDEKKFWVGLFYYIKKATPLWCGSNFNLGNILI